MILSKLAKHIEELEEITSGNSKDAVTFAGKGLDLLKSMLGMGKPLNKKVGDAGEIEEDEDDVDDPANTNEDQDEAENAGKMKKSTRNGGDIEEAEEDPDDPAQAGDDAEGGSIITNHGKKIPKKSLNAKTGATKKSYEFNEDKFQKSFVETYEDHLDASDALMDLTKSVIGIGRASNDTNALIKSVMEQNVVLAKAVGELLKSQASIAAEMELVKKQPATSPSTGYVVMSKKEDGKAPTPLRKSDIQDTLTDMMNDGLEMGPTLLKRLGVVRNQADLNEFIDSLPEDIREKL